jgi:hypothetical protein
MMKRNDRHGKIVYNKQSTAIGRKQVCTLKGADLYIAAFFLSMSFHQ